MPRERAESMPNPSNLFRLLSEFIFLLLGALLVLLAVSRTIAFPTLYDVVGSVKRHG
jgi:hypothetical protein